MTNRETFLEDGLPSSVARVFAVNCFSLSALNLILLLPPFYGSFLISDTIRSIRWISGVITIVQMLLVYLRPNIPYPTNHNKVANTAKLKTNIKKLYLSVVILGVSAIVFHIIFILFGAPFVEKAKETFHFALLMTVLTTLPLCLNLGLDFKVWMRIFLGSGKENILELYVYRLSLLTLFGAWTGAFPIILDWDRPWQVWPITCCYGALIGNAIGNSYLALWVLLTEKTTKSKRRKRV